MIIYYLAAICPQKYRDIAAGGNMVTPAYKFNKMLAEGFSTISGIEVRCIVPKVYLDALSGVTEDKLQSENGVVYVYANTGRKTTSYFSFLRAVASEIKSAKQTARVLLICDALSLNSSLLCLWMKWFYRITNVAILTDVPSFIGASSKSLKGKLWARLCMWPIKQFDRYVVLTEQLGSYINKRNRPQCLMEGLCDSKGYDSASCSRRPTGKKICLYAGSLHQEYGIITLVHAFIQMDAPDCELHIYGDGNCRQQIEQLCSKYRNVHYFGIQSNEYILKQEQKATLLINPRPSSGEYTKYSFPSKTLEYMASGTPVLMTKLPGLPQSYYPYLYLFEEESVEGFRKGLEKVLGKTEEELFQTGSRAQRFVLENKRADRQAKKIFEELKLGEC